MAESLDHRPQAGADSRTPDPSDTTPYNAPPAESPDRAGSLPAGAARYRIEAEVGQGGMGAVYRAFDANLGRTLAIKVLHRRYVGHADLERRFLAEARITGQLQHPGVPPVHELGQLDDGQPFFAMKLIEGRTLAELMRDRRSPEGDQPRFLAAFEQVCQTLAYAHDRGVLHRDLKPGNVMVGAFGEVQVMDWGLAKPLGQAADAPGGPAGEVPAGPERTEVGSVLGTWAYMAPEQARGELDRLDKRADVFGLGAMLCAILTGRPPYAAADPDELRRQAREGDVAAAEAALSACGADQELVDLARACLSADPERRPADAGEVAARMTAYLEGVRRRLHEAEVGRAAALARARADRRARRLTLALAAGAVVFLASAAAAGAWLFRREVQTARAAEADLDEAGRWRDAGQLPQALAAVGRAEGRLAGGAAGHLKGRVSDLRAELEQTRRRREVIDRLDEIRLQSQAGPRGDYDFDLADRAYAALFGELGIDVFALSAEEAARRVRASPLAEPLILAMDDWALPQGPRRADGQRRLREIIRLADDDPWRARLREAGSRNDRPALEGLAREPATQRLPPTTVTLLAAFLRQAGSPLERDVLAEAQMRHPGDFWLCYELATSFHKQHPPRLEVAHGLYRAALALRPDSPGMHLSLGVLLHDVGRDHEAVALFEKALRLQPDLDKAYNNLSVALHSLGRADEASAALRRALELRPDNAAAHLNRAKELTRAGKLVEAEAAVTEALRLDPTLAAANLTRGIILNHLRRPAEAAEAYREAIRLSPNDAIGHYNLGLVLKRLGQADPAIAAFREAIRLDPGYAAAAQNLANTLADLGRYEEAVEAYHAAIRAQPDYARPHYNLSVTWAEMGKFAWAVAAAQQALRLLPTNAPLYKQAQDHLRHCELLLRLEVSFPALLRGDARPETPSETLALAELCHRFKKHHAAAARHYAEAFAAMPQAAGDLREEYRSRAAAAAALAAAGEGEGAATLTPADRARLRGQALDWLRADLAAWAKLTAGRPDLRVEMAGRLKAWGRDRAFDSVRAPAAVAKLPQAEQAAWRSFWAEVGRAAAGRPEG